MLEFGDSVYYLDLKTLEKVITQFPAKGELSVEVEEKITMNGEGAVTLKETFKKTSPKQREIDAIKYDLLKTFVEYIIDYDEISDDTLGADRALSQSPFAYKLVFNTLLNEGIIKEKN